MNNFETLRENDYLLRDSEGLGYESSFINNHKLNPVVLSGGMNLIVPLPQTNEDTQIYENDC